jgi:hypothetical protein
MLAIAINGGSKTKKRYVRKEDVLTEKHNWPVNC